MSPTVAGENSRRYCGAQLRRVAFRTRLEGMNDHGITSLTGGESLDKSAPIICAVGSMDELNAALGLLRAILPAGPDAEQVAEWQRQTLRIGAELATGREQLPAEAVAALDRQLAEREATLPPLDGFVLPGNNETTARAHWARVICRRAERAVVAVRATHPERVFPATLAWLNRLSSCLFALARAYEPQ